MSRLLTLPAFAVLGAVITLIVLSTHPHMTIAGVAETVGLQAIITGIVLRVGILAVSRLRRRRQACARQ